MAAERDFNVRQPTLFVHISQCTNTVNDESVIFNRGLETLFAAPYVPRVQSLYSMCDKKNFKEVYVQVILFHEKKPH